MRTKSLSFAQLAQYTRENVTNVQIYSEIAASTKSQLFVKTLTNDALPVDELIVYFDPRKAKNRSLVAQCFFSRRNDPGISTDSDRNWSLSYRSRKLTGTDIYEAVTFHRRRIDYSNRARFHLPVGSDGPGIFAEILISCSCRVQNIRVQRPCHLWFNVGHMRRFEISFETEYWPRHHSNYRYKYHAIFCWKEDHFEHSYVRYSGNCLWLSRNIYVVWATLLVNTDR